MFLDTFMNKKNYGKLLDISINEDEYHEFTSNEDANKWGHLLYDDWAKEYEKNEGMYDYHDTPIFLYTGTAYRIINDYKRGGAVSISPSNKKMADCSIPEAIHSAPHISEKIVVYRIISGDVCDYFKNIDGYFSPLFEKAFLSSSLLRDKISEHISTLKDPDHPILLKIYVPENTEAVFVNSIGGFNDSAEAELLINHNQYLYPIKYPYVNKTHNILCVECLLSNRAF
ncbi:MAG: ADP-ribosyltransferase [Oscillospiraceae bacterium]|nr:ADP-ribosyltransferase [Oscillospiraceae bacterium]